MASQKMKFEMSIEKLSFKFEGDFEQGQRIQNGISKALGEIASLQSGAVGLPATQAEARVVESPAAASTPRHRRKRKGVASTEESSDETIGTSGEDDAAAAARRPSGASPKKLLMELRHDSFFDSGKKYGEIIAEINRRGHTKILPTSLPAALATLAQDKVLNRNKSAEGVWVYTSRPNNG
jgi:hypothetical protein